MTNAQRAKIGERTFKSYIQNEKVDKVEAEQDYTITDCISDLMHYAKSRGFDADVLIISARNHFTTENKISCRTKS